MPSEAQAHLGGEEYRMLVEQAPILIWRSGVDTLCDYFNQRWLDFTGRTLAEEMGNGWAEGVHPDDFQRCLDIYLGAFGRREAFEMEYRLRRYDGAWRWIFDRGAPSFDQTGTFRGYIGSCIDVTERVQAQEALAKTQEAQLKTLRGLLPICMICRKVRDDKGYWDSLESYICSHSDADFSHGVCPECQPLYRAKLQREMQENE